MKLYLVRHGPAESQSPTFHDFDRVLTTDGRKRVELVAAELGKRDEAPKRIITSPLRRAVETAEVVSSALGLELGCETSDDLAPGGDAITLVRRLVGERARKVMLVGHEPDMSSLASLLLPSFSRGFDKAMVLGLRVRNAQSDAAGADGLQVQGRFVLEPKDRRWVIF
jgi:phosphohistidine phosphatase